jgi:hypothetical protein
VANLCLAICTCGKKTKRMDGQVLKAAEKGRLKLHIGSSSGPASPVCFGRICQAEEWHKSPGICRLFNQWATAEVNSLLSTILLTITPVLIVRVLKCVLNRTVWRGALRPLQQASVKMFQPFRDTRGRYQYSVQRPEKEQVWPSILHSPLSLVASW